MKKYTNKILLITLIVMALLVVVMGTVEIRKAFHNGQIRKTEEFMKQPRGTDSQRIIIDADTILLENVQTENEK